MESIAPASVKIPVRRSKARALHARLNVRRRFSTLGAVFVLRKPMESSRRQISQAACVWLMRTYPPWRFRTPLHPSTESKNSRETPDTAMSTSRGDPVPTPFHSEDRASRIAPATTYAWALRIRKSSRIDARGSAWMEVRIRSVTARKRGFSIRYVELAVYRMLLPSTISGSEDCIMDARVERTTAQNESTPR